MKQLLKAVLKRKKHLVLIFFSLFSVICLAVASQIEILSLGVIVKTGPDAFVLFGRKEDQGRSQEIDRESLLQAFEEISQGSGVMTLSQAKSYLAKRGNLSSKGRRISQKVSLTNTISEFVSKFTTISSSGERKSEKLYLLALVLVLVALFKAVSLFYVRYLASLVAIRISRDLRFDYFAALQKLPLSFFHKHDIGNLSSRITLDSQQIAEAVNSLVINYVQAPVTFLLTLGVCFSISWQFSLLVFLGFPLLIFPVVFLARKIKAIARRIQVNQAVFSSVLLDFLSGIMTVKLFRTEDFALQKYTGCNDSVAKLEEKSARYGLAPRPILHAAASLFLALVMLLGLYTFSLSPSDLLVFCGLLYLVYEPVKKFADGNTLIMKGCAAAERLHEVLFLCQSQDLDSGSVMFEGLQESIEFRNVSFSYDSEERNVITNLSLTLRKGECLGVVGHTGSGKSTIIKLLPRLYEVSSGEILIDGKSLKDYDVQSIRKHIACVLQKPFLFYDTIANNLTCGQSFSEEEILKALRDACALEFVEKMPKGIHSVLEESGKNLSGGQQQRLTIARALLHKSSILLLDEATSSLDAVSETHIKEMIENLKGSCTQIIVAHRLSTLEHVDRILYLENGKKVAEGSKDELLKNCPAFREMWQLSSGQRQDVTEMPSPNQPLLA